MMAGVTPVDGDAYFTGAQKNKGYRYYYSEKLEVWILQNPDTSLFHVRVFGWEKKDTSRGFGAHTSYPRMVDGIPVPSPKAQELLRSEYIRVKALACEEVPHNQVDSYDQIARIAGKPLTDLKKVWKPTTPSAEPSKDLSIDKDLAMKEPSKELTRKIFGWLDEHLQGWAWTDEEIAEIREEFIEKTGLTPPPPIKKSVTVSVPEGFDLESLKNLGIEVVSPDD